MTGRQAVKYSDRYDEISQYSLEFIYILRSKRLCSTQCVYELKLAAYIQVVKLASVVEGDQRLPFQ